MYLQGICKCSAKDSSTKGPSTSVRALPKLNKLPGSRTLLWRPTQVLRAEKCGPGPQACLSSTYVSGSEREVSGHIWPYTYHVTHTLSTRTHTHIYICMSIRVYTCIRTQTLTSVSYHISSCHIMSHHIISHADKVATVMIARTYMHHIASHHNSYEDRNQY